MNASWPCPGGRVVSAPLPSLSASLLGGAILRVSGVSSDPQIRKGPTATHQLASPWIMLYSRPIKVLTEDRGIRCGFAGVVGFWA